MCIVLFCHNRNGEFTFIIQSLVLLARSTIAGLVSDIAIEFPIYLAHKFKKYVGKEMYSVSRQAAFHSPYCRCLAVYFSKAAVQGMRCHNKITYNVIQTILCTDSHTFCTMI